MMWFYIEEDQQVGPVSDEDAQALYRSRRIHAATLVWQEGMPDWEAAGRVPFFADLRADALATTSGPPPLPPSPMQSGARSRPQMQPGTAQDEGALCILAHLLGLLTGFLGPLIILLVANTEPAKAHARRALNWQISFVLYVALSFLLMFVVVGIFTFIAVLILDLVFCIIAMVKAGDNKLWNYPMAIPILKD